MSLLRKEFYSCGVIFAFRCYKKTFEVKLHNFILPFCSNSNRKDFFMHKTKKLIFTALFVALNIVFARYLSIQTPITRIDLGFIPIALSAMLFGPYWAAGTYAAADILGTLLSGQTYFPLLTINSVLYGLSFGWFFYNRNISLKRIIVCVLSQILIINLPLTSLWLYIFNQVVLGTNKAFWAIFTARVTASFVIIPTQILVLWAVSKYLKPHLAKIT